MLIRYIYGCLREIPDELAIKVLADPADDEDLLGMGTHWVNVIVHGVLGTVFDPIKDDLPLTITVYDPACGSGGMLTESQNFIVEKYPVKPLSKSKRVITSTVKKSMMKRMLSANPI